MNFTSPAYWLRLAHDSFQGWGLSDDFNPLCSTLLVGGGVIAIAWLIYGLLTKIVIPSVLRLVKYTPATWDDILLNPSLLKVVSELVFILILSALFPDSLSLYPTAKVIGTLACRILVVVVVVHLINRFILALYQLLEHNSYSKVKSLKGLRQMLQVITVCIGIIIIISILADKNPIIIISGLGAAATVLMLVFKDSIMGVVAGVQLSLNDMLRPGDWITVPSRNINGIVKEVGLTTVKVQNFDLTTVTVPPYSLVSESFQNWRTMKLANARRICRAVLIDINTIAFASPALLKECLQEEWGKNLLDEGKVVNLSLFRYYLEHYIASLSITAKSSPEKLYMVRELAPTPEGIPVEIYLFVKETDWKTYEAYQADIMDHVVASASRFGLRIYQAPSSADIRSLRQA